MPTVHANGIDIHYEVQGEGEPIVLIPYLAADQQWQRVRGDVVRAADAGRRCSLKRPIKQMTRRGPQEAAGARSTQST